MSETMKAIKRTEETLDRVERILRVNTEPIKSADAREQAVTAALNAVCVLPTSGTD